MVERDGLENRCGRKFTEGSNPSLSDRFKADSETWRSVRVAEGARLEIVCGASHRGFDSLLLRINTQVAACHTR